MKRKRFVLIVLIIILTIVSILGYKYYFKNTENYISKVLTNRLKSGNKITSLETPENLVWEDESIATAAWGSIIGANYYYVNVYIYNVNNELIAEKETGTSNNKIDLQQELVYLLSDSNINEYKVSFDVIAAYLSDEETILSEKSNMSPMIGREIGIGTIKLSTPKNITIDDNYNASWTHSKNSFSYSLYFTMNDKIENLYGQIVFQQSSGTYSYGTDKNGIFEANIEKAISEFYKYMVKIGRISVGQTVRLRFNVSASPNIDNKNNYISSEKSNYSNEFVYSDSNIIKLSTPSNIMVDDNYNVSWTHSENSSSYRLNFSMNGEGENLYGQTVFQNPSKIYSYGTVKDGIFEANIEKAISEFYKYMVKIGRVRVGQTVTLKFRLSAESDFNNNYISSNKSNYSKEFIYSDREIVRLSTPTNITVDDDYNVSWTHSENSSSYRLNFSINGKGENLFGQTVFQNPSRTNSYGTVKNGVFEANIEKAVAEFYNHMVKVGRISAGQTVTLKFRLSAEPSLNNNYISSYKSNYSNAFYYNSDGPTKINKITLSPENPIVAIGRSFYIGKTIEPDNAYYSNINWSSSNKNVASISNLGKLTGIKKGNSTITAQINNAVQTAEVTVYEIKSNVDNSEESIDLIEEANEVIESVILNGDISNTDITDRASVINKIKQGAENGNLFKVDVNYFNRTLLDYDNVKDELKDKFENFKIIGGQDINIEVLHQENKEKKQHIANITKLKNEISIEFDISSQIPSLSSDKKREYKLVNLHDGKFIDIDFDINDGVITSNSNKFSDFIVLYKDTDIPVSELVVDKTEIDINTGETASINVQVLPSNAANKNFFAESNNSEIAIVENNIVTGIKPGKTKIKFTSEDGNFSRTVIVNVKSPLISINLQKTEGTLNVGETETLKVKYNPINTTDDKTIVWTSSDEMIATVEEGLVMPIRPGTVVITAKVGSKTVEYNLTVKLPLESISLDKTEDTLIEGEKKLFSVMYNPINTTDDKTIVWTSSDETIATVNGGDVLALKAGNVIITAKVGTKTATCNLTVIPRIKLTSISLNNTSGILNVGDQENLEVTYNPIDTTDDKTITWIIDNAEIVTVNNGKVKAISPGSTTIIAKVGNVKATYNVTIKAPLIEILFNKEKGTLKIGTTETLKVLYKPINTTDDKTVVWKSTNPNIATVENGKILALKVGETKIIAEVGGKVAHYPLFVVEKETLREIAIKKGFKTKNNLIYGFKLNELISNIKRKIGVDFISVSKSKNISTGTKFKYNTEELTVVVYGDLNGDGKINSADLLSMRQHLLGTKKLKGAYKEAGSIAKGEKINSADLLRIRQHLLGRKAIKQ